MGHCASARGEGEAKQARARWTIEAELCRIGIRVRSPLELGRGEITYCQKSFGSGFLLSLAQRWQRMVEPRPSVREKGVTSCLSRADGSETPKACVVILLILGVLPRADAEPSGAVKKHAATLWRRSWWEH